MRDRARERVERSLRRGIAPPYPPAIHAATEEMSGASLRCGAGARRAWRRPLGLRDRPDGRVGLACALETEAAIFELSATVQGAPAAWAHLPSLHAPAVVVAGDRSFLPLRLFEQQAAQAGCPLHAVGGGHFWLQEDAGRAANLVRTLLGGE